MQYNAWACSSQSGPPSSLTSMVTSGLKKQTQNGGCSQTDGWNHGGFQLGCSPVSRLLRVNSARQGCGLTRCAPRFSLRSLFTIFTTSVCIEYIYRQRRHASPCPDNCLWRSSRLSWPAEMSASQCENRFYDLFWCCKVDSICHPSLCCAHSSTETLENLGSPAINPAPIVIHRSVGFFYSWWTIEKHIFKGKPCM